MWTPEFEMTKCWDIVMASDTMMQDFSDTITRDLLHFDIDFALDYDIVIDIGGGAMGGIFCVYNIGKRKILIDPLAEEYKRKYNKIPEGVETINAYCNDVPLEDNSIDIIFCFDTLDHCNSKEEYIKSISEIKRILKVNGTLYFILPLRQEPAEGHPIVNLKNMPLDEILKPFEGLDTKYFVEDGHLYLRGVKI